MKPITTLIALGLGLVVNGAYACGIDWNLPKNHFDGVNEFGFVSIWENIGEIDTGDGLVLPLNINFRSDRNTSSSTLGAGWHLALLDSNIVQVDERTFMMFDPAGPFRLFWRDAKNPNILGGQAGWKAEIRGDAITAWADCGGIKLVFNKGRIASMQVKDKTFTYDYQNGQISKLREGNTPILKVERAPVSDEVTGLTLANNQKIEIKLGERPRVQTIQGKNLVVAKDLSLASISTESQEQAQMSEFEYGVNDNLQPTITLKQTANPEREIVWNASTRLICKDGEWTYAIKTSETAGGNAAIGRSAGKEKEEFWHYDGSRGKEVTVDVNGKAHVRKWFVGGKLNGLPRSILEGKQGSETETDRWVYDEIGRPLRVQRAGSTTTYQYISNSNVNIESDGVSFAVRDTGNQKREIVASTARGSYLAIIDSAGNIESFEPTPKNNEK
jgi:hypothetical protein